MEQIPSRDERTFWKTASLPRASDRISLIKLMETDLSLVAVVSMFESRLSFCGIKGLLFKAVRQVNIKLYVIRSC